jgi:hypothetical protein
MARLSKSLPTCLRQRDLPQAARASLAAFMDAVVIVDLVRYQRRRDERPFPTGATRALVGGGNVL